MDVYEAVTSRRAVRGFTDEPVSREVLERVLSAAAWAPSGSNVQPWRVYVVTGVPLAQLKKLATERVAAVDDWDEREYVMYPPTMKSPYGERRSAFGKERYSALGIEREDWEARMRAAIANWDCFGAPAALFCYIDRDLGLPQWSDLGMYLQTVMLLLRAERLHSCPQMAWSQVRETVSAILSPPDELMLFCGMSIGYEDPLWTTPAPAGRRSTRRSRSSRINRPLATIKIGPALIEAKPVRSTGTDAVVPMSSQGRGQSLRGRVSECETLRGLISTAQSGSCQVLVLRGEAGVGKTALLEYVSELASGFRCVQVAGVQSDMELAFAGLQQLCAPLMDHVDELPEPQREALNVAFGRGVGPTPDRFLVGLAVLSLMAAAAT